VKYTCDRCGSAMIERQCKVICPNCGNRFDCSDLTLNFEDGAESRATTSKQDPGQNPKPSEHGKRA
jgi:uncharacterized Zn finger protein (UPF0148 family)